MLLPERLAGAVWGHLAGDVLGVPYEFRHPSDIGSVEWGHRGGTHHQPPGTWSDDGALMLALLDSLLHAGPDGSLAFDTTDQARRALAWYERGAYAPGGVVFDVGTTTRTAIGAFRDGSPAEQAGPVGESLGNGSLMRILPLALVERPIPDRLLVEHARRASRVTHGRAECQVASALYSLIVRRLLHGEEPAAALEGARADLRAILDEDEDDEGGRALDALEAWPGRSGRGHVLDAFWSAWEAFAGAPDYRSAVERAVRYGHDTDTTAAICGGLAGAHWGLGSIPFEWLRALRDRHLVAPLVDALVETDRPDGQEKPWRTSTASPLRLDLLDLRGTGGSDAGGQAPGRVGITFLPGKRHVGRWTGPHWRDLETDVARLAAMGVDVFLLLVEDAELRDCRVPGIALAMEAHGIELLRFPIRDPRIPTDDRAFRRTVRELLARVREGETLAIACRGGLDRSGLAAACLLREAGLPADDAIERVHAARRHSLTMPEQLDYVRAWRPA